MVSNIDITTFYIILGFIGLIFLIGIIFISILFRRRKLMFIRFLDVTGKWEILKQYKVDKTFDYDGCTYKFDIKICTRDFMNRPIASYYKGNPEQMQFNYEKHDKLIKVGTQEISGKDVRQILLTKIIKDIFSDDNVQLWFIIITILLVVGFIAIGFMVGTGDTGCVLTPDNETLSTIRTGVIQAISGVQ